MKHKTFLKTIYAVQIHTIINGTQLIEKASGKSKINEGTNRDVDGAGAEQIIPKSFPPDSSRWSAQVAGAAVNLVVNKSSDQTLFCVKN